MALTQTGKPMAVTTPLGADALLLNGVAGEEGVSMLFEYTLELLTASTSIDPSTIVGQKASFALTLADGSSLRNVYGMIRRFSQLGTQQGLMSCRAVLVPSAWVLTCSTDWRIFSAMTTQAIIEAVLQAAGITDFKFSLSGTYVARDYCAQFGETNMAFISRLMEEEGIYYFFDHTGTSDVIVFADAPAAVKPISGLDPLEFTTSPAVGLENIVYVLAREDNVCVAKVTVTDFDFTKAGPSDAGTLTSNVSGTASAPQETGEVYQYPGGFAAITDGDTRARVRLEGLEALAQVLTGESNCRALATGWSADITAPLPGGATGPFHLLKAAMKASLEGTYTTGKVGEGMKFSCTFTAIPQTVPYRPPLITPKPVIRGTQTAIVTGPSGDEIYTDAYGRVKVHFHWDRLGKFDDTSSFWVRVATPWAGKGWGMVHVPRVGQEVVVSFLDGDPDRPLITGLVYNAEQTVPYTLPDNKTQSGIKSRSSTGGSTSTFNEIRFEDLAGSELVNVQAQKDLTLLVTNDETRTTNHDRIVTVKNNDTLTVSEGDQSITVTKGKQTIAVNQGDRTITVGQGNQAVTVSQGNDSVTVSQGNQSITISAGNQTLDITQGKQTENINGDRKIDIKTGNDELDIDAGNLTVKVTTGNISTTASAGNISTTASVGKISMSGTGGIELTCGGNSIKIDQSGVTIAGLVVKVTGQTQTQIAGLMTQINGDAMLQMKGGVTMIN